MLSYLNPQMCAFIARQEMFFLATSDAQGDCDVSFRAGEVGFVHALGGEILVYPEYRGNGVMASLGNIAENPHAGLLFVDFIHAKVGLHVNGAARILSNEEVLACPDLADTLKADIATVGGPSVGCWSRSKRRTSIVPSTSPGWRRLGRRCATGAPMTNMPRAATFFRPNPRPGTARSPPSLICGDATYSRIDRITAFLPGISREVGYEGFFTMRLARHAP
jgi:hypothetical protein